MPAFITRLRDPHSISCLALEFVILTASRTGEVMRSVRDGVVMAARWDEIDRDARIWTVPAVRMKMAREHRVPLTKRMLAILDEAEKVRSGPFIFPNALGNEPLSRDGAGNAHAPFERQARDRPWVSLRVPRLGG